MDQTAGMWICSPHAQNAAFLRFEVVRSHSLELLVKIFAHYVMLGEPATAYEHACKSAVAAC